MRGLRLLIDGEEVKLAPNGKSGGYAKFQAPEPYASMPLGEAPLIVSVYIKPGWKPSKDKAVKKEG